MVKSIFVAVIASIALLTGMVAFAKDTLVIKRDGMTVTLTKKACSVKPVLDLLEMSGLKDQYKWYNGSAVLVSTKESIKMCYAVNPADSNDLYIVDERGGNGPFKLNEKK